MLEALSAVRTFNADKEAPHTCLECNQTIAKKNEKPVYDPWDTSKVVGYRHAWCKIPKRYTKNF